jgi:UPF0042 nucleotide-binding protein
MVTRIVSFGFKYGTPVDADLVLDVRFLDNPYFVPELKPLTGLDEPVARYVLDAPETREFLKRTRALLEYVMPRYEREGKSYLTIAVGCTGGRHRSVAVAEAIARDLSGAQGMPIAVLHRDATRGNVAPPKEHVASPSQPDVGAGAADDDVDPESRASVTELKGVTTPPPAPSQSHRSRS